MQKKRYKTIAMPALGTGNLFYPYISVARAIKESVTEFGRQHSQTSVKTVYIILHKNERHCIQVRTNFKLKKPKLLIIDNKHSGNNNTWYIYLNCYLYTA